MNDKQVLSALLREHFRIIDPKTVDRSFLQEGLDWDMSLSRITQTLVQSRLASGSFYMSCAADNAGPIPDLIHGGEGEPKMADSDERLSKLIENWFEKVRGGSVIFENRLASREHPYLTKSRFKRAGHLCFLENEVYQYLSAEMRASGTTIEKFVKAGASSRFAIGLLCGAQIKTSQRSNLNVTDLERLAGAVYAIVFSAFDAMGYVIWDLD